MLWILTFTLLALVLSPVILLTCLVLFVHRLAVLLIARIFLRTCLGYESIVSGLDAYFLVDSLHVRPHFTLSPLFVLEGHVDLASFRRKFLAATAPRTDPGTRRLFQ